MKTKIRKERGGKEAGQSCHCPTHFPGRERQSPRGFPYEEDSRPQSRSSKAAIPPPVKEAQDRPRSPNRPSSSFLANVVGTVAHNIMQKRGFREGQSLGEHQQGLRAAFPVGKTSNPGGKIIMGDAAEKDAL
ncbi:hypothetical protein H8958_005827 [Nasalis larvatus]